jgi:hypothetical protein
LTTITADSMAQRVVHTSWPEDQPGKKIEPTPIDWMAWRAERAVTGLSRLPRADVEEG